MLLVGGEVLREGLKSFETADDLSFFERQGDGEELGDIRRSWCGHVGGGCRGDSEVVETLGDIRRSRCGHG